MISEMNCTDYKLLPTKYKNYIQLRYISVSIKSQSFLQRASVFFKEKSVLQFLIFFLVFNFQFYCDFIVIQINKITYIKKK